MTKTSNKENPEVMKSVACEAVSTLIQHFNRDCDISSNVASFYSAYALLYKQPEKSCASANIKCSRQRTRFDLQPSMLSPNLSHVGRTLSSSSSFPSDDSLRSEVFLIIVWIGLRGLISSDSI